MKSAMERKEKPGSLRSQDLNASPVLAGCISKANERNPVLRLAASGSFYLVRHSLQKLLMAADNGWMDKACRLLGYLPNAHRGLASINGNYSANAW